MKTNRKCLDCSPLWAALTLALLLAFTVSLQAQETPRYKTGPPAGDNDTTTAELASMDRFLDGHPEIAERLRKDPSLINNQEFVENHPELQEYLQSHPRVREEITENPNAFMQQEHRYDEREDRDRDTTRRELASMDRFLDSHPEIAERLRKDPSLVNNREFVESHPALQEYLQSHPQVREEFRENPNAFMQQENRYDEREDRDRDTTHRELASMDRFLDSHPEIAERLRKDPSLVNNKEFVETHPALQEYLQSHPEVREEFRENPNAFMQQENRYDQREDAQGWRDHDRDMDRDRGEMGEFGDFLRKHPTTADRLSRDPSLANNREFLESNPELRDYLRDHPGMQKQLSENPQSVMTSPGLVGTLPQKTPTSPQMKPEPKQ